MAMSEPKLRVSPPAVPVSDIWSLMPAPTAVTATVMVRALHVVPVAAITVLPRVPDARRGRRVHGARRQRTRAAAEQRGERRCAERREGAAARQQQGGCVVSRVHVGPPEAGVSAGTHARGRPMVRYGAPSAAVRPSVRLRTSRTGRRRSTPCRLRPRRAGGTTHESGENTVVTVGSGFLARSEDRLSTRPAGILYWLDDAPPTASADRTGAAARGDPVGVFRDSRGARRQPLVRSGRRQPVPEPVDPRHGPVADAAGAYAWADRVRLPDSRHAYRGPRRRLCPDGGGRRRLRRGGRDDRCSPASRASSSTFAMHRLRVVLPNEVAGVVVLLIGVALVGARDPAPRPAARRHAARADRGARGLHQPRGDGGRGAEPDTRGAVRGPHRHRVRRAARARARPRLSGRRRACSTATPWFALPQPWAPRFGEVSAVPMLAFLVALVALKATAMGSLVVIQRGADGSWSRPDAPPIRRGLLANGARDRRRGRGGRRMRPVRRPRRSDCRSRPARTRGASCGSARRS